MDKKILNSRRYFVKVGGLLAASALTGRKASGGSAPLGAHVVIVGGGFGGATLAKYLRMWSNKLIKVTLIEANDNFVSCPFSNFVLVGLRKMSYITHSYSNLSSKYGVNVLKDRVSTVDTAKKTVKTTSGKEFAYDKLVLATGIDFDYSELGALGNADMQGKIMHAWKAGAQTETLAKQIQGIKDGGVMAISIPKIPYRCPPGPYERASLIAEYFKKHKPKSKLLVLDANEKIQSKEGLFKKAWEDLYNDQIEYIPNSELKDVKISGSSISAITEFDEVKVDVLNAIPNQRAGDLVLSSGIKLVNNRWAQVNWMDLQSTNNPDIHIIGDSTFPAPTMPKSGHMANQHAKVVAAAIIDKLSGNLVNKSPLVINACYSFVAENSAMHVSSVHSYDQETKTMQPVKDAGGLSKERNGLEALYATAWAENIWSDILD